MCSADTGDSEGTAVPITDRFEIEIHRYPSDHQTPGCAGECYSATIIGLQQHTGITDESIGLEEEILNDSTIHVGSVLDRTTNKRTWYGGLGTGQECFSFRHAVAVSLEDELTNAPSYMRDGMLFHAVDPFTGIHYWWIAENQESLRYCTEEGLLLPQDEIDEVHAHARDHSPLTQKEQSALDGSASNLNEDDDEASGA